MPPLEPDPRAESSRPAADPEAPDAGQRAEKRYWRSLERLLDSPAVDPAALERTHDEFPRGASEAPGTVDRRTMLGLMGASFAFAGLQGCRRPVEKIVPYVSGPEHLVPGVARRYATTMPFGAGAYGVVVESHEGRPTKVEGNELHPSSGGAASAWMQAAILELFDPDRAAGVSRLAAGESEPRKATWEQADAFFEERRAELEASGGAGLAVLSGAYSSPTLARLRTALEARYPGARWAVWEPLGDAQVLAGCTAAAGTACRPVYHLERAKKILALDADFLLAETDSLRAARGFAGGRRVVQPGDDMNRLYAVESTPTVTGAAADHRLRAKSRDVAAFAAALARRLGVAVEGRAHAELPADLAAGIELIAADLAASPGEAVVIAGRAQPAAVHALTLRINQALGALGETLTLHPPLDAAAGGGEDLAELVGAMRGGEVTTLVILDGNPVYDAPADLDFAGALGEVEHVVHLAQQLDETSRLASWHLPALHFLESWGDARAADGTLSVVQPLIAPLYGGRSALEIVARLIDGGAASSGYEQVRETWRALLAGGDFERRWRRVLHDGVLADSATPPIEPGADAAASPISPVDTAAEGQLEIVFRPSYATFDGRFANNSWLQELPDPITKITWNNAALLSPATAARHGVESGELVTLGLRGRSLELPVFVLPGQADDSVAVALGYGRRSAGRVGDGVGIDAYALRDSAALDFDGGASLAKAAGSVLLAQTQEHWSMEGRGLVREATLEEYREDPHFAQHTHGPAETHQLFPDFEYAESPQWGMSIDLHSCIGCNACVVACQSENNVPVVGPEQVSRGREMHWLRVDRYFAGDDADPEMVFQPVPCMHCENAPCEQVCPVAATVHDREGINAMVYNRCIGTRYCSNNCPYKVRRFNFFNYTKDTPELMKMAMNPDVTVRSRGVMEKCTYCLQRVSEAKIAAKSEGRAVRDGEVKTACQQTCPVDAISFGDIRDPASEVSRRKGLERNYALLSELNVQPRTTYLAKLRNPNPAWRTA